MQDQYKITGSNDVALSFAGGNTGGVGNLMVSSFDLSESHDDTTKHGVSNHAPIGQTTGNSTYEFEVTLEGENASVYQEVEAAADNRPQFSISVIGPQGGLEWTVPVCWPRESGPSGDDGDAIEYSVSGQCMEPEGR